MKKYLIILGTLISSIIDVLPDTVELKSGVIYSEVVTTVEANSILIYKEDGGREEILKSELKKITLKNVTWRENEIQKHSTNEKSVPSNSISKNEGNTDKSLMENNENKAGPKEKIAEKENGFFFQTSLVDWQVGGMGNLVSMRGSRLINSVFFRGTNLAWLDFPILPISENSVRMKGRSLTIGYKFFQKSNYPAKLQLNHLRSDSTNFNSVNSWEYSDPSLVFSTLEVDLYKFNANRRYILTYEHRFFLNSLSDTLYYSRFGIQGGLNLQSDLIKGQVTPVGRGSATNIFGAEISRSTLPLPAKTSYSENSYFVHLGIVYQFTPFINQQLEINANWYKGISRGDASYNLVSVYPIGNGNQKKFNSDLSGFGFNLSYIFKLSQAWNIRLTFENRVLSYNIQKVQTTNLGIGFGDDLGPTSTYQDKLNMVGIALEYKF